MGNSPIERVDPDGGFDWYKNDKTGEIKWFDSNSKGFSDVNGESWTNTNFGSELLEFNGTDFTYSFQTGNVVDGFNLNQQSFNADSGRAVESTRAGARFDYSKERQSLVGQGPIPEGKYFVLKDRLQSYEDLSFLQKAAALVGRGQWPGGTTAWGNFRFEIYPKSVTINDVIRGNFFIHGGSFRGSAGCIDLCNGIDNFTRSFINNAQNKVHLIVNYDN